MRRTRAREHTDDEQERPSRLIRDSGTPHKAPWSQPLEEREPAAPEPDLMPWQSILPPLEPRSEILPAAKVGIDEGEGLPTVDFLALDEDNVNKEGGRNPR